MAMDLHHHGVDRSVIALWLGHESIQTTQMYLHADMRMKEEATGQDGTPQHATPSLPTPGPLARLPQESLSP